MASLGKSINDLKEKVDKISYICSEFKDNPSQENGEKIIEIIKSSEKKLLTVKSDIVIMVNEIKEKEESFNVEAIPSNNGFIIKNE